MIPYIEDFYSPEEATAFFSFIRVLPFVRPRNLRNKTSLLRRMSFPGYSPPLNYSTNQQHHTAGYDVAGLVDDAPDEYKEFAARLAEYAASVSLPTPINYLSTIGYLTDDHMNFHQHAEDQKREDQTVYVVSFGAVHPVAIRSGYTGPKRNGKKGTEFIPDGKDDYVIYPKHGSLYVLPSSFNEPGSGNEHQHAVLEGDDYSFSGLRISINCKHIPAGLSPDEMKRACSRPAGRSQSQDAGLLMNTCTGLSSSCTHPHKHTTKSVGDKAIERRCNQCDAIVPFKSKEKTGVSSDTSPRVCWGSREDFPDALYTGRKNTRGKFRYEASPFANELKIGDPAKFRKWALEQVYGGATMLMHFKEIRGKDLLCPWCKPGEPNCHARVWLELANLPEEEFSKLCAEATENFTALQEKRHAEMAKWNPLWQPKHLTT